MKHSLSKQSRYEWGILWMLISAAALSVSFLFLKINLAYVDYFTLIFLRFSVPFLFVLALLALRWDWKHLFVSPRIGLQLLRSLCVLVSQYGVAYYIASNSLLNATMLLNASPLFIPLIAWIFQGHRPGKSTIVGVSVAFIGVILVLHPDSSLFSYVSAIGLIAAVAQAGSQVLYGLKSKKENLLVSLFYLFFFTTVVSGIIDFRTHLKGEWVIKQPITPPTAGFLALSIILMAVGTLCNQYFRGLAYRYGSPTTLTTFLYFSVFVSALLDWLIFKNAPVFQTVIGGCLIILGGALKVFLRARIRKKKRK